MRYWVLRHWAAVLTGCLLAGATAGVAVGDSPASASQGPGSVPSSPVTSALSATALWPRFTVPQTVYVADTNAPQMSGADLLTATTLEGIYNAAQKPGRLYLIQRPEDQFWLTQLPAAIHIDTIEPASGETLLQTLLKQFLPVIKGAIVTDPQNADTSNLATTMAGLDHAIVISPSQKSEITGLGIKVIYNFDTAAFTHDSPAQTYQWGVANLLKRTSAKLLVMLSGTEYGDVRDYAVATGSFIFWLTSTSPAEKPVMNTIIEHTPANTPVMGYIPDENPDVSDLSAMGHFLNASDQLTNESFWASVPGPTTVHQRTQPAPLAARAGTVYVAFLTSDGDNAQFMQHRMAEMWNGPDLGSVPAGWTVAPGTVDFDPTMLEYYTSHLPADSELDAGPSGIGYVSQMNTADLSQFARLSAEIMAQDGLHTTDSYEPSSAQAQYAKAAAPAPTSISQRAPLLEQQIGDTILYGQTSWYIHTPDDVFCLAHQQSQEQPGKPVFLEPLFDAMSMTPVDMLHIAQQLTLAGRAEGLSFVFTTPTELALTMQRYDTGKQAGLPAANAQSMTGAQVLAEPSAGAAYPFGPVKVTGPNLVTNPNGALGTMGWSASGGTVTAAKYQGHSALHYTSSVTGTGSHVSYNPGVAHGKTYTLSVNVAGSGQVFLDVYTGSEDDTTLPVRLTSSYQHLTWTVTIPASGSDGPPQLKVAESGAGPVSVYISGASVAASTAAC